MNDERDVYNNLNLLDGTKQNSFAIEFFSFRSVVSSVVVCFWRSCDLWDSKFIYAPLLCHCCHDRLQDASKDQIQKGNREKGKGKREDETYPYSTWLLYWTSHLRLHQPAREGFSCWRCEMREKQNDAPFF